MSNNDEFITSIVGQALKAQEQHANTTDTSTAESKGFSAITEQDGYVGEMVKQALFISEADSKPINFKAEFPSGYTVILTSLKVDIAGTDMEIEVEALDLSSLQELISYVESQLNLSLDELKAQFTSDDKVQFQQSSEYGLITITAGLEAYESVPLKQVLRLS